MGFEELSAGLEGFIDEPEAEQVDDEFPEDGFAVGVFGGEALAHFIEPGMKLADILEAACDTKKKISCINYRYCVTRCS